ncbi:putative secondary metabolism biosynthetic enzyme [Lecanicillium sp. MT-2017a]|nr:putative secondary metabolism biosynthetic enzyme [Lecanicillium sp. MT-2017a]
MWHPGTFSFVQNSGLLNAGPGIDDCAVLLAKHTLELPLPTAAKKQEPSSKEKTVLITGTTGRLGSHLLEILESVGSVKTIVCLNRKHGDILQRQILAATENGIRLQLAKLEFLCADVHEARLGLPESDYARLLQQVDYIVHNAWPLNFALPVAAFEPNIQAVRSLVDFAAAAAKSVRLTFVSSAATAARWMHRTPVPEAAISDMRAAATGYGQSKRVADLLLQQAAERCGVPATVVHVGQVAGSLRCGGVWNPQEWLPSLVCSSVLLKALPSSLGQIDRIDWVPAEQAARAMLEFGGIVGGTTPPARYCAYNLINPRTANWKKLVPSVRDYYLERGVKIRLVSLSDWVGRVKRCPDGAERNPAIKFIGFLKALVSVKYSRYQHPGFCCDKGQASSEAMRNTGPITGDMMRQWCAQWNFEQA